MQGMCLDINDLGNYHEWSVYRRQGWPARGTVPDDPEVEAEHVDGNASLSQVYGDLVSINVRRDNIVADNNKDSVIFSCCRINLYLHDLHALQSPHLHTDQQQ
jgi:hypothetical protein